MPNSCHFCKQQKRSTSPSPLAASPKKMPSLTIFSALRALSSESKYGSKGKATSERKSAKSEANSEAKRETNSEASQGTS
eukprot:gene16165-4904_t